MNMYDYIKYYKDMDLKRVPFNYIDGLIFATLAYAPYDSFKSKTFSEFVSGCKKIRVRKNSNSIIPIVKELSVYLENASRYKDVVINNFIDMNNKNTQFGALCITFGDNKIICFEGTDGSSIGWLENFRCMYEYPTFTQKLASEYLNDNITSSDKKVYVLGHSKGGNMAMSAAMETSDKLFKKIEKVINYDGPGFRKEEYKSKKYERLSEKLVNIMPSASMVGALLYNNKYSIIKPLTIGVSSHFPSNWNVFGEFFVRDSISAFSIKLHEKTTKGLENINMESAAYAIELLFDEILKEKKNIHDIKASDLISIYRNVKTIDSKTFDYIFSLIASTVFESKK